MSVRHIIETFERWRGFRRPLVLATVFETVGSTYSKAGHRILIAENGDYQGLVSGGCLEGDLAARAGRVARTRVPAAVIYDLRDEADEPWGLGVGCNGLIRVFMQPLLEENGYEPFASLAARLTGVRPGAAATVISSSRSDVPAGAMLIAEAGCSGAAREGTLPDGAAGSGRPIEASGAESHGRAEPSLSLATWSLERLSRDDALLGAFRAGLARTLESRRAEYRDADAIGVLYSPLVPIPRLLVLGAGLDAVPVVNMAADVGWFVTVADHRPAYLEREGLRRADRIVGIDRGALGGHLALGEFDAILVMSHHLETDRTYLAQLADVGNCYLGVLGPPARRERLLEDLGADGERLRPRLKGPVGLDIGADSPESIALSIVAELQHVFATRKGAAG